MKTIRVMLADADVDAALDPLDPRWASLPGLPDGCLEYARNPGALLAFH